MDLILILNTSTSMHCWGSAGHRAVNDIYSTLLCSSVFMSYFKCANVYPTVKIRLMWVTDDGSQLNVKEV